MSESRELLTPEIPIINKFNDFWDPQCTEREIRLFKNTEEICRIDESIIPGITYFKEGDVLLSSVFEKIRTAHYSLHDVETAVYLLDGIYHTYLRNHLQIAEILYNLLSKKGLLDRILEADEDNGKPDIVGIKCVDTISCAGKLVNMNNSYNYSFATKFCHWIRPDCFPIYDSIACGLFTYYLRLDSNTNRVLDHPNLLTQRKNAGIFDPNALGYYQNYVDAYGLFRDIYDNRRSCTLKQIDVFLWTYGKALASKTICYPVARYITYKPLRDDDF